MITEILPNLFQIKVPLPGTPLKELNSYLIKGPERHLLIDTGFNRQECKDTLTKAFAQLEVEFADCDFFITHLHADHSGLVSSLVTDTSNVYCSQIDGEAILRFLQGNHWRLMGELLIRHGFPADMVDEAVNKHPASKGGASGMLYLTSVNDGDWLEINGYKFECILTPGHTPGHVCLYEPDKKILISGDHILGDITPNITVWPQMTDSLVQYLDNLDKIARLEVKLVLPGHRSIIQDCQKRIEELKTHHEKRLVELMSILSQGPQTAFQAAANMTWDLTYRSWDDFPLPQKWFASGETASHLEYLVENGVATKENCDGKVIFSLL